MNFFQKVFGREQRAATPLSDPSIVDILGSRAYLGTEMDVGRSTGLSVAIACVNVLSQNLSSVPLTVFRTAADGGREKATDHPLYAVLHDQANDGMTAFEAREVLIANLVTNGNAYAEIVRNSRAEVTALIPIDPGRVRVEQMTNGRIRYKITELQGGSRTLLQEEILHLRYRLDRRGIMGLSPVMLARETFALGLQQQKTALSQAQKSFRPEGVLSFAGQLPASEGERLKLKLERKIDGGKSSDGVWILDGGASFSAMAISSKDAEFLESRKLTNLDICRIWGIPPTCVGIPDHATYSNIDQEARALVQHSLAPLAKRIEQAMNIALLSPLDRQTYFVEHDLGGLLRGDPKARYEAYQIGRNWGWLSPNEIRRLENLPAIPGGDEYLSPLNMTTLGNRDAGNNGTVA
jgi:HK97 family phage portal protein